MTTIPPHYTSPLRVSETSGQEDSSNTYFERWEKYSTLPLETQEKLESEETAAIIYKIQKFHNLSDETTANISRLIRGYYFGELKEFDFVPFLMREPSIDQAAADRLAQLVIKEILEAKPEKTNTTHQSDENNDQQKSLPLMKALSLYPKLEDYILTKEPFTVVDDEEKDPQKGTVKNWIFDYHMNNRGKARRSITDRDNYLTESENAKNLSEKDRQKVLLVLESFDENTPLLINIKNKTIIFNIIIKTKEVTPQKTSITPEPPAIGQGISKQVSDGKDHFNDKFSSTSTRERLPLKHEEMIVPLHARTPAADEEADQATDQEMSAKQKQQLKRSSFHMKPIDTTAQQSRTNKEVFTQPQESSPETEQEKTVTPVAKEEKLITTKKMDETIPAKQLPINIEEETLKTSDSIESPKKTGSDVEEIKQTDKSESLQEISLNEESVTSSETDTSSAETPKRTNLSLEAERASQVEEPTDLMDLPTEVETEEEKLSLINEAKDNFDDTLGTMTIDEDAPTQTLGTDKDAIDISDVPTPAESDDPIINLPRRHSTEVTDHKKKETTADDREDTSEQPKKAVKKRSPFQMKPIK